MKKILIALDYGPTAQIVAKAGISLAKAMKAGVTLVCVIAEPVYAYAPAIRHIGNTAAGNGAWELNDVVDLKKTVENFLVQLKWQLGNETIMTRVKEGDIAQSIWETAKDIGADIIVMGSHGHRCLEAIIMGSTTEKVLCHTTVPLFIIPTRQAPEYGMCE